VLDDSGQSGGCGCRVPGESTPAPGVLFGALALAGLAARRRRRVA
jgi:MYXO-CTERM domain-containing protein